MGSELIYGHANPEYTEIRGRLEAAGLTHPGRSGRPRRPRGRFALGRFTVAFAGGECDESGLPWPRIVRLGVWFFRRSREGPASPLFRVRLLCPVAARAGLGAGSGHGAPAPSQPRVPDEIGEDEAAPRGGLFARTRSAARLSRLVPSPGGHPRGAHEPPAIGSTFAPRHGRQPRRPWRQLATLGPSIRSTPARRAAADVRPDRDPPGHAGLGRAVRRLRGGSAPPR